jgi:hypothetical protein
MGRAVHRDRYRSHIFKWTGQHPLSWEKAGDVV